MDKEKFYIKYMVNLKVLMNPAVAAFIIVAIVVIAYFVLFRRTKMVLYYNGANDKRILTKHADSTSLQIHHTNEYPTTEIDHGDVINSVFNLYTDPKLTNRVGEMLGDIRLYDHKEDHVKHVGNVSVIHLGDDKIFMRGSGLFTTSLQNPYISGIVTGGTGKFADASGTFVKKPLGNSAIREMTIEV